MKLAPRAGVGAAMLVAASLLVAAPAPAGASYRPRPHVFPLFSDTANAAYDTNCARPSADPVPDGQPIVVQLPPAPAFTVGEIDPYVWRHPMVSDPTWRLNFEGFRYIASLAARAAQDHQLQSMSTIVGQLVAFHQQNPDPGTSQYGWDEGTAQRRLQAENCVFALSHDVRLISAITADVNVQLGPRYYGPPKFPVHNHGLMANLRVLDAGELLANSSWTSTATTRMRNEAPKAFSPAGTTIEQSSEYQRTNEQLWSAAADRLDGNPAYASTVDQIRATTAAARGVFRRMTEPDGKITQYGDAERVSGDTSRIPTGVFRDDIGGVAIGRWTPYRNSTYYVLRYGPRRYAHGHDDRDSVTWTTMGARVVVNVGVYDYANDSYGLWMRQPAAANVAIPTVGRFNPAGSVTVVAATLQSAAHAWRMRDLQWGSELDRDVNVNATTHTLRVKDTYAAGSGTWRQHWHLDASWTLVSADTAHKRATFTNDAGRHLTVTTTGAISALSRGATNPVAGWTFPMFRTRVPSYELIIRSLTTVTTTTFVVT